MKPLGIIGLVGRKHSGKDTAHKGLVEQYKKRCIPFVPYRFSFGDILKSDIAEMLDTVEEKINEHKELLRSALQDYGQKKHDETGGMYLISRLAERFSGDFLFPLLFVVTDVRRIKESEFIRSKGGVLIRLHRAATDNSGDMHITETELEQIVCDYHIHNDGPTSYLDFEMLKAVRKLLPYIYA